MVLFSPRLAALVACGSSAASQLEHHVFSPRLAADPLGPRLRASPFSSNGHACGINPASQLEHHVFSPRLAALVACGSSAASQLEHHSSRSSPARKRRTSGLDEARISAG